MDATFVWKLAKLGRLGSRSLRYDDDFVDRLNYQLTGVLLFLFIGIIGIRQYVGKPIQCWSPQEFTRGWEEYAENYCWVSNTYYASVSQRLPSEEDRENLLIKYYQWAWIFMGLQALFFYIPCVIWRGLYNQSRYNVRRVIQMANCATDTVLQASDKHGSNGVQFIAKYIDSCIRRRYVGKFKSEISKTGKKTSRPDCCGKRAGNSLTLLYLFVKLLYILNTVIQVHVMDLFTGTSSSFYGISVLINLIHKANWDSTGHFPRVTFCDFQTKKLGKNHKYTLQCVLPINMILEKMFIILWFWIVMLAIVNIFSFILCCGRLLQSRFRVKFVRKHLHIMGNLASSDRPTSRYFVEQYLRADVVFLIRLISENCSEFVATQLTNELWLIYTHRRRAELEIMKSGHASVSSDQKSKFGVVSFGNNNQGVPISNLVNQDDIV